MPVEADPTLNNLTYEQIEQAAKLLDMTPQELGNVFRDSMLWKDAMKLVEKGENPRAVVALVERAVRVHDPASLYDSMQRGYDPNGASK